VVRGVRGKGDKGLGEFEACRLGNACRGWVACDGIFQSNSKAKTGSGGGTYQHPRLRVRVRLSFRVSGLRKRWLGYGW